MANANDCLFCKIAQREIPSEIVYEDDRVVAFKDIAPQAPVHLLIIPRRHIATLADIRPEDAELIGHMHVVATQLAEQHRVAESGYRAVINCREDGQQSVFHLHLHLLGGRKMTWPPG